MNKFIYFFIGSLLFLFSCTEEEEVFTPKPKAFMRIDFPEKKYVKYDSTCPFLFDIPTYAAITFDKNANHEPCWFNVSYLPFHAQLHVSYKSLNNNLRNMVEDSRELAIKHQIKASGLDQSEIRRDSVKVYGLIYDISGNTASSMQFYLTDSSKHFLRASLYFNVAPNIDSLQIVVDYLKKDLHQMINSFKWKE